MSKLKITAERKKEVVLGMKNTTKEQERRAKKAVKSWNVRKV